MKKLFIVLALATAFASCNDEKKESSTETSAPATTEVAPTPTETAPAATDAPTTTATSN